MSKHIEDLKNKTINNKEIKTVCPKCGKDNVAQARYCVYCKEPIPKEQQDEVYAKTFFGKISKLLGIVSNSKKGYEFFSNPVEYIKNYKYVKFGLIALFVSLTIYMQYTNKTIWNRLAVLSNDYYTSRFNGSVFMLTTDCDEVSLKIASPKKISETKVFDGNGDEIKNETSNDIDKIGIVKNVVYELIVEYEDGTSESTKFRFKDKK